jgi:single-strand DNA-binding protein
VNTISLIGRLTADPQARTAGETEICDLRLAVPRRPGRDGEDRGAVFVDVTTFGRLSAIVAEHLSKGRRVGVIGRLELDEWEAADGSPRRRHKVVADQIEFLDRPAEQGAEPSSTGQQEQRSSRKTA